MTHKQAWKNQLWNVSLFPAAPLAQAGSAGAVTPPEPAPRGGSSLTRPALLSVSEPPSAPLARAA